MARKTTMELRQQRWQTRQEKLRVMRQQLIDGLNYEGVAPDPVREALCEALRELEGMLSARVSNPARTELAIDLRPTNDGYAWPEPVYVAAGDQFAAQVGRYVGYEVAHRVADGGTRREWRRMGIAAHAMDFWKAFVEYHMEDYRKTTGRIASYRDDAKGLLFDTGDMFARATRAAVVIYEADRWEKQLAEALEDINGDVRLRQVFQKIRDDSVNFLRRGLFEGTSTAPLHNFQKMAEGAMRARIVEACDTLIAMLGE